MKKIKIITIMASFIVIVASLTACTNKDSNKDTTPSADTTSNTAVTTSNSPEKSDKNTPDVKQKTDVKQKSDEVPTLPDTTQKEPTANSKTNSEKQTTVTKDTTTTNKEITSDEAVEVLKTGYLGGGVDIVFDGKINVENHDLYKYSIMYVNAKGETALGQYIYVETNGKHVYNIDENNKLIEDTLPN